MEARSNRTSATLAWSGSLPALVCALLLIPALSWAEQPSPVLLAQAPEGDGAGPGLEETDRPEEGAPAEEDSRVLVGVGSQSIIEAPGITRVAVGDPSIADVLVVEGNQVLVTGLSHGTTSLLLWFPDGSTRSLLVEVSDEDKAAEVREAVEFLGLADEIEVRVIGRRIVIDGRVDTVERYERYQTLVRNWPQLVDLVRFDPGILIEIAERIQGALREAEIETVEVRVVGGTIFLEGTVADEAEMSRVLAITRAIHGSADGSRIEAR